MTQVCVMGFQHDLVNYVLVIIFIFRASNWDKFRKLTELDDVLMYEINCLTYWSSI